MHQPPARRYHPCPPDNMPPVNSRSTQLPTVDSDFPNAIHRRSGPVQSSPTPPRDTRLPDKGPPHRLVVRPVTLPPDVPEHEALAPTPPFPHHRLDTAPHTAVPSPT